MWKKNDIVQIHPDHDKIFGGCLMIVTETNSWGVQGYFDIPKKGLAYYRVKYENATKVGKIVFAFEDN